jgi:hypothetical protein
MQRARGRGPSYDPYVTYYDVLGVSRDATPTVIRHAYVTLARQYHPDQHADAAPSVRSANERAMQAVNEAWSVLSDPVARRRYDERELADRDDSAARDRARRARHAEDERARAEWRPFHDDEDADDLDPRLLDDDPGDVVVTRGRQFVTVLPTLSFFAGVGLVALGLVINLLPLSALGIGVVVLSALGFLLLPLFALSASARNDRR